MGSERLTFGQVMNSLLKLEEKVLSFYKAAADQIEHKGIKDLFLSFIDRGLKRKEILIKTRRETVTEMTLEPITSLNLNEKIVEVEKEIENKEKKPLNRAAEIENTLKKLYSDVSRKITYISADTSYLLDKFAREHGKREKMIKKILEEEYDIFS